MKATKSLFQQLHEANLALNQKQNDINELVEALRIATNCNIDSGTIEEYNALIQKHTKK